MFLIADIDALRQFVACGRELFEPLADEHGTLHWSTSLPGSRFTDTEGVPLSSLKPFFFAERETVFVFDGTQFRSQMPEVPARVFFGVKACDAAALNIQDRFFAEDPYYQARRQAALVVAIDCLQPCHGGFCPLTGAGPLVQAGADIVLTRLPQGWLAQGFSENGKAVLEAFAPKTEARTAISQQRQQAGEACRKAFGDMADLHNGLEKLQAGAVTTETWETLAIQCLSCSGCVNLCPSCSCFTTFDTATDDGIRRERVWDACLYEGFQREASGHNPSPTPGSRTARYWFHKFSPAFIPQQGRLGCTGCGRCDAVCPGVIGAKALLARISTC